MRGKPLEQHSPALISLCHLNALIPVALEIPRITNVAVIDRNKEAALTPYLQIEGNNL